MPRERDYDEDDDTPIRSRPKGFPRHGVNMTAFHEIIETPRVCSKFTTWVPALTPKEHFEMMQANMLREEIEARRIRDEQFQKSVRRSDRQWSIGQAIVIAMLVAILGVLAEPWKDRVKVGSQPTATSSTK